tara:strand:- start:23 stop:157 length:135 start_codon:yes stop_codon:yes gene_type:complete
MNCNKKINYVLEKLWMGCKELGVQGNMATELPTIASQKMQTSII